MVILPKTPRKFPAMERAIYDSAAERHKDKPGPRKGLRMSGMGGCPRAIQAQMNGVPTEREFGGQISVTLELGGVVEPFVVELLGRAGYDVNDVDPATGRQFELSALDGRLTGHTDGQIHLKTGTRVLEIKSANLNQFEKLQKLKMYEKWNPKYYAQIQCYMGASGIHDSVVIVFCKNDSRMHIEKIRFDPSFYESLLQKARTILDAKSVLPRPPEGTSRYCKLCKWCNVGDWCYASTTGVEFDK